MTNLLKYHTFIPYEDTVNTKKLMDLLRLIYLSDDPLANNYSPDKFDLDNQLAVTFGIIENEIVLFDFITTTDQRNKGNYSKLLSLINYKFKRLLLYTVKI